MSRKPTKGRQPAKRQQQPQQQRERSELVQFESYSGPFPPAAELERLNQQDPRAARIIFDNFDEQGRNRRDLEQKVVSGSERRADRGQAIGAGIFVLAIICGLIVALAASATAGASIIVGTIGSGALIYIVGGRAPRPDQDAG